MLSGIPQISDSPLPCPALINEFNFLTQSPTPSRACLPGCIEGSCICINPTWSGGKDAFFGQRILKGPVSAMGRSQVSFSMLLCNRQSEFQLSHWALKFAPTCICMYRLENLKAIGLQYLSCISGSLRREKGMKFYVFEKGMIAYLPYVTFICLLDALASLALTHVRWPPTNRHSLCWSLCNLIPGL